MHPFFYLRGKEFPYLHLTPDPAPLKVQGFKLIDFFVVIL